MSMSLWNIEQGLADLMEQREHLVETLEFCKTNSADTAGAEAARQLFDIDLAIAEYVKAEVRKVDNIRGLVKHLEMIRDAAWKEADAMKNRAQASDRQLTVLKNAIQITMEEMEWREGKPRKLEGKTGSISLKGNGGRQPVVITDEALIPDEFLKVTVTMDAAMWRTVCRLVPDLNRMRECRKEPNLTAIGNALAEPCGGCGGTGKSGGFGYCIGCGGSGKNGVPGATLAPRSSHVEVK